MQNAEANGLKVGIEAAIATVALNRPKQRNAIDAALHGELEKLWPRLAADRDVRAIIFTGTGDFFSAGGDLVAMAERAGTPEGFAHSLNMPGMTRRLFGAMLDVPQPIIAAINGHASGLGATLGLFADITVISEDAKIGDSHVDAGLVAGDGGAVIWPILVGLPRAKEMLMRARMLTGSEALEIGLVNYALPREQVLAKAMALATELAAKPPLALQWTKQALNIALKAELDRVLDHGMALEMMSMNTADHREALVARLEKRLPRFEGR